MSYCQTCRCDVILCTCRNKPSTNPTQTDSAYQHQAAQERVSEALRDSAYLAGATAGWNAAQAEDPEAAFASIQSAYSGRLAGFKEAKAVLRSAHQPGENEVTQNHTAFPMIQKVITDCVHHNGGTAGRVFSGIEDPEADVIRLLDECLGADGVHYDDLKALDDWLATLPPDDLETVIDGEETEVGQILASAPNVGDATAREWIDQTYEHCI